MDPTPLDLILANANVITMNPRLPRARSVGIRDGKIVFVSKNPDPLPNAAHKTEVLDLRGKTVVPGFIDPHCHLAAYARSFMMLDCSNAISVPALQQLVKRAAQSLPRGAWVLGEGYNEFNLAEQRHATRWDLDAAAPAHPVCITHRSGHAHLLNSAALALLGITAESGDPPDALIERDLSTGEPNGLLFGFGRQIAKLLTDDRKQLAEQGIRRAGQALAMLGVTSVHDTSAGNGPNRLSQFRVWQNRGDLPQRVSMALGWDAFRTLTDFCSGILPQSDFAGIEGVKIVLHEVTGQVSPSQPELNDMVLQIHQAGYRAVIHAVDEAQILAACRAIEHALSVLPAREHGHRIEHCSVCPPALAERLAAAGITVVTQPVFVYQSGDRYLQTVPEAELAHLYPVAALIRQGILVAGSSDFPIAPPNPLLGIYAAVARKSAGGAGVLPQEAITPEEALSMFTSKAARAIRKERILGSIETGKLADLVILSGDPTAVPAEAILEIEAEMTFIHGKIVWEKNEGNHAMR